MPEAENNNKDIGSVFDLIPKSYELVKRNWLPFLVVNIFTVLSAIAAVFDRSTKEDQNFLANNPFANLSGAELTSGALLFLGFIIISLYLFVMATILEVETVKKHKPGLKHLFNKAKQYFLPMTGLLIISGAIVALGLILLIIPGLIALVRIIMAPYFMVDKKLGVFDALKASNEMGKQHFWQVAAAVALMFLIAIVTSLLGAIPIVGALLGAAITIATALIIALRYQQLRKVS